MELFSVMYVCAYAGKSERILLFSMEMSVCETQVVNCLRVSPPATEKYQGSIPY